MIYPSADKLENWGSKYSLVVLAAKRAKQIKSGAPPLIPTTSKNPLTIALEEIAAGVVLCQVADHDVLPKTSQETEVAQLLAIPTLSAEDDEEEEAADDAEEELKPEADDKEEVDAALLDDDDEKEDDVELEDEEELEIDPSAEDEPEPEAVKEQAKPKRTRKKAEPEVVPDEDGEEEETEDK